MTPRQHLARLLVALTVGAALGTPATDPAGALIPDTRHESTTAAMRSRTQTPDDAYEETHDWDDLRGADDDCTTLEDGVGEERVTCVPSRPTPTPH